MIEKLIESLLKVKIEEKEMIFDHPHLDQALPITCKLRDYDKKLELKNSFLFVYIPLLPNPASFLQECLTMLMG